jgi:hypothetical protein
LSLLPIDRVTVAAISTAVIVCLLSLAVSTAAAERYFDPEAKKAARRGAKSCDEPFLVDVGSRVIAPGLERPVRFLGSGAEVYLQFERPLKGRERGVVKRLGVRFYGALTRNTYLTKIKPSALEALRQHPSIRGIEAVHSADKLTAPLYRGTVAPHVVNPDGSWSVVVRFYEDVKLGRALHALNKRRIRVPDRSQFQYNEQLRVEATQQQILDLSGDPAVRSIGEIPTPPVPHNTTSQAISNVDDVQAAPFNLDGAGVVMGIWDGGEVLTNHPDLTGRVTLDETSGPNDHSTHVAGTMLSSGANNAAAEGMAPAAGQLYSYNFNGNTSTEQNNSVNNRKIVLSNHSWGFRCGWNPGNATDYGQACFGRYDGTARDWDDLVQDTGLIIVKSSGNDSNDLNPNNGQLDGITGTDGQQYDTISEQGNAKNVITVGAIQDNGTTVTGFSSTGPANDGRIKPDVVANGQTLMSTWAGGVTLNDCGANSGAQYCPISGTSMSTPTVSGSIALLVERYRDQLGSRPHDIGGVGGDPSPDIVKALIVNTAQDLGRPGPDYIYGHGLVDALAAVNTIDVGEVRIITEAVDQGEVDEYVLTVPAGSPDLRVTLVWIDPEGVANNAAADLVNDLDVELIAPDGTTNFPWTGPGTGTANVANNATNTGPNTLDNVEDVLAQNPDQGFWTIRVSGTAVPDGPQNYALVANQAFSLADQPDIRVNAPLDFDVTCTDDFQDIRVSIFNTGGADLLVDSVSVVAGAADFSVLPNPTQPIVVKPGAHVDVTVRFSPTSPGLKTGTLRIVSNDPDTPTFDIPMTGEGGSGDVNATLEADGDFGNVALGGFGVLTLEVLNQGTCNLEISNVTRVMGSADFSVGEVPGEGFPSFPLILSADANVDIPIKFEPTSFGLKEATFRVLTDDPDSPEIDVNVLGSSPPSDVRVTGSSEFGEVCADEVAEVSLDICNVGLSDLVVNSVQFNPPCDDFELVNNPFPSNVSHDFCLPLTIRYAPMAAGNHSCVLEIETNDPDSPVVTLEVTGTTPLGSIDVPSDLGFSPTVIQSVDACESSLPFPVSNTGSCNLVITDFSITANETEYFLSGLPSYPIILEPGHVVGEGELQAVFTPTDLGRSRAGQVSVTYVTDPITGATEIVRRNLCGEGVRSGARILVTRGDVPLPVVKKIKLQRFTGNLNKNRLDTIDVARNLELQTVTPTPPCEPFQYHREYGTISNPIQLAAGAYKVKVVVRIDGKRLKKTIGFDVTSCDFNPTIVVDF